MDFLIRHYEKLILVVCLLLLLYSLQYVSNSQTVSLQKTREVKDEIVTIVKGDSVIEEMNGDSFESLDQMLLAKVNQLDILESPNTGVRANATRAGLMEGGKFVICKNRTCGYVLPYDTNTCPWCHAEQDPVGPEMEADYDTDKDGIPDIVEKETLFLHYRYRFDAMEDLDQDGFMNIEEYRAGTAMDDPKSIPALAYLLRVEKAERKALPVSLKKIKQNGSANQNDWKASLNVDGEGRPQDVKLNGVVPRMKDFKVTAFAQDMSSVTISDGKDTFTLVAGAGNIREENYSISLRYLGNHVFRGFEKKTDVEALLKAAEPGETDPRKLRQQQKMMRQGMNGQGMGMGMGMNGMDGGMDAGMGMGMGMGMNGMGMNGQGGNTAINAPQLVFEVNVGDVFALKKESFNAMNSRNGMGNTGMGNSSGMSSYYDEDENQPVVEYYQLLDVIPPAEENGQPVVRVQKLTSQFGSADGEPIVVVPKDTVDYVKALYGTPEDEPNHDYVGPNARGNNGNMGGNNGMGMGMGMGMDAGMGNQF